jgi:hypothetical protein
VQRRRGEDTPVVYDQHMRFLNMSSARVSARFINLVREPVARAISSYYYSLSSSRGATRVQEALARRGEQAGLTIDACLAIPVEKRKCFKGEPNILTAFFCGNGKACMCVGKGAVRCPASARAEALKTALHHLHTEYLFVGLQAQLPASLCLLERLAPAFAGISELPIPHERANAHAEPGPAAVAQLTDMLDLDVRLYAQAVKHFKRAIGRFPDCVARLL